MSGAAARIDLRTTPLSLDEVVANVSRPGAGGIATFLGVVRDESDGHRVTRLDYSAYEAMAKREMAKVAEELESEIEGLRVSVVHRLGELGVGDAAIVCAASAPHRAEAFRACRSLIDRIKERVPIWKREWGPDGAAWVGWVDARCSPHDDHARMHEHPPTGEHR